jgi:hypothetical protein
MSKSEVITYFILYLFGVLISFGCAYAIKYAMRTWVFPEVLVTPAMEFAWFIELLGWWWVFLLAGIFVMMLEKLIIEMFS